MKDSKWRALSVAGNDIRSKAAKERVRSVRQGMQNLLRESRMSPPATPMVARPVYNIDGTVLGLGLSGPQSRKAKELVRGVVDDTRSMFGVGKEALDIGMNKYQTAELLRRALELKRNMQVRKAEGGDKPPSGFTPIKGSTKGGYHRKTGDGYDYWYPGQGIVSGPRDDDRKDSKPSKEVVEAYAAVKALAEKNGMKLNHTPTSKTTLENIKTMEAHVKHAIEESRAKQSNTDEEPDKPEPEVADNQAGDDEETPPQDQPEDQAGDDEGTEASDEDLKPIGNTEDGEPVYNYDDVVTEERHPEGEFHPADMEFGDDGLPVEYEPPSSAREMAELRFKIDQMSQALEQVKSETEAHHQQTLKYLQAKAEYVRQNPTEGGAKTLFEKVFAFLNLAVPTAVGAAIGGPAGAVLGAAIGSQRQQQRARRRVRKGGVYYDPKTDRLVFATADNDLYKADSYKVPEGARGNARKVLEWKKKHGSEVKGMTSVGWARARQLATQTHVGLDTVKRMSAFNRHRQNAKVDPKYASEPWKDRGYVAWLGWGGSTGVDWARRITGALDKADNLEKAQRPSGSGWAAIPQGKKGGYRRPKGGGGFEYWYPDGFLSASHAAHHRERMEGAKRSHANSTERLKNLPEGDGRRKILETMIQREAENIKTHGEALSAAEEASQRVEQSGVRHSQSFRGKRTLGVDDGVVWSAVADGLKVGTHQRGSTLEKYDAEPGQQVGYSNVDVQTVTGRQIKGLPVRFKVADAGKGFHGHLSLRNVAKIDPETGDEDFSQIEQVPREIVVFVPKTSSLSPDGFMAEARRVLSHELAHSIDEMSKRKESKDYGKGGAAYYNDPAEVVAFRHNVFRELNTPEVVEALKDELSVFAMDEEELADLKEWKRSEGESTLGLRAGLSNLNSDEVLTILRKHSPSWNRVNHHLNDRNRRKFLQTAAAVLSAHVEGTSTPMAKSDAKKTPAKPHERVTGSKRNKPGSAATASGSVSLSAATVETLKNKVKEHNEKSSKKVTLGQLKAVYRRGSGAFSTSHHPNANRHSWSMGRVNSFLRRVKGGNGHSQDDDLIRKAGPYIGPRGGKWADPQHKIPWDDKHHANHTEYDRHFSTGKPVTLPVTHRKQKTQHFGSQFGQDIEPAGRYVVHGHYGKQGTRDEGWGHMVTTIHDTVHFRNPLVIHHKGTGSEPGMWKRRLSDQYGGKTGKALSRAIAKDGHDGIVTIESRTRSNGETVTNTSEIVDLTHLHKSLSKGGPYIGPRGGKWADPQHTIPWKPEVFRHSNEEVKSHDLSAVRQKHGPPIPVKSEDGGPLTVFQGNDASQIHGADGGQEAGIYLTPNRRYARQYGSNLHRSYIAFSNPLIVENKGEIKPDNLTHGDIRRLISQGYDGIIVKSPGAKVDASSEIIAFSKQSLLPDIDAYMNARNTREDYAYEHGLEKAMGPYIGPRGGKWADPQHKIPWDDQPSERAQRRREEKKTARREKRDPAEWATSKLPVKTLTISGERKHYRLTEDGHDVEYHREWTSKKTGEKKAGWFKVRNLEIKTKVKEEFDPERKKEGEARRARQAEEAAAPAPEPESSDDYRMDHQPTKHSPAHDMTHNNPSDIYEKPEYYTGFPDQLKEFWPQLKAARGNPNATITMYRAMPKNAKGKHFQTGNWVTLSRKYAEAHAAGEDNFHIVSQDVPLKDLHWAGDDLAEWGYWGGDTDGAAVTKSRRPPPPAQTLTKAQTVQALQRAKRSRRPKNEHGHRDGLTPGDKLTIRKSHITADNPDHVVVKTGGKFQWGDRIYPNARRLLSAVTGNPNHHLTARRYFRLED